MLNKLFLKEGLKQLKYRKFMSIIIILSISIGISFFIGITSIGEGIKVKIINEIKESEDLTLIEVKPGYEGGTTTYITDYSLNYIEKINNVTNLFPFVLDSYVLDSLDMYFSAIGANPEQLNNTFQLNFTQGELFEIGTYDAVLGYSLARKFEVQKDFCINDTFTARIRIYEGGGGYHDKNVDFKIKGILDSVEYELNDKNVNNLLFFDITNARNLDEKEVYDGLVIKSEEPSFSLIIAQTIENKLELNVVCAQEEIDAAINFSNLITLSLGFFSSLTLILGVVLIIAITTISIYQRTTEIGTMKALGASNKNIIKLIIFECGIFGLISGILGMIGGFFFAIFIDYLSKPIIGTYLGMEFITDFQITIITPQLLIIGFFLASSLCILSGILPAIKAAKLNPIDALKQI